MGRYHIHTRPAPLPAPYPARFRLGEGDDYVKYGHAPFEQGRRGGDAHWTPEAITQIWYQAEIPLPILFDPLPMPLPGHGAQLAVIRAAAALGTLALVYAENLAGPALDYAGTVAPILTGACEPSAPWLRSARLIELEDDTTGVDLSGLARQVRAVNPHAVLAWRLPLVPGIEARVEALVAEGAGMIHLVADETGLELAGNPPRFLADVLQAVHERLVQANARDQVTLVASGGMAAAEHVPKAMVCGADAVAIDYALVVALGCGLWADVRRPCPVEDVEIDAGWGAQRIVNLMAAWRDQLLEVLGAMGMREVRRLRGELGRTIFYRGEERAFRALFGRGSRDAGGRSLDAGQGEIEGDLRWPTALLLATSEQARTGRPPTSDGEYRVGRSGGGFDRLRFGFELDGEALLFDPEYGQRQGAEPAGAVDLALDLNRRDPARPRIHIPHPWYGAGMSFGSVSLQTMTARARAAQYWDSFTSTGEGGYPDPLIPYADHIITQIATGLFGVRKETIQRARIVEFKYAQGAKPGLGGHLLGGKVTPDVAAMREAVQGTSLFSPFPFHSVYSVEDHKKHVDWVRTVNPRALISVKVSTPTDVDMVAVGSYFAGAHIVHLDGAYGGTGAAPEIAKKNIAMPLEYAIPKVHRFLEAEGIRDQVVLMASGGVRTAFDVAKAIALGADGCIVGTAELVALGCLRLGTCERGKGCPLGIATTDPELARQVDPLAGGRRIANLYASWRIQLAAILQRLGLQSVGQLRGRSDLLVYLE